MRDPTGRIARWLMFLQQYTFDIEHRRGRSHANADALSRLPVVHGQQPDTVVDHVNLVGSASSAQQPEGPLIVPSQRGFSEWRLRQQHHCLTCDACTGRTRCGWATSPTWSTAA
jgi:hypothetical protein